MAYSDLYLKRKTHISKIMVGVAGLCLLIFLGLFFKTSSLPSKASSKVLLRQAVVNVSPVQVGLFWQTERPEKGWIVYGEANNRLDMTTDDERDIETNKNPYFLHYSVLRNLDPGKTYFYEIVNENGVYRDQGKPFSLKTPKNSSVQSILKPAYGKVILANSQPAEGVFVIFNFDSVFSILAVSKLNGEFLLPLNYLVEKNTVTMIAPTGKEKVSINIFNDSSKTQIEAYLNKTNPLPQTIILGKDYNFLSENVLGAETMTSSEIKSQFGIIYPKENAIIPAFKPLIKGKAVANSQFYASINSYPERVFNIKADKNGDWNIIINEPIASGSYTLTVTGKNPQGNKVILRRNFTIAKSGEQVLGEATPEPTLMTSPSVMPSPTVFYSSPTPSTTSATLTPPRTGQNMNPLIYTSASLIILGAGLLLVF